MYTCVSLTAILVYFSLSASACFCVRLFTYQALDHLFILNIEIDSYNLANVTSSERMSAKCKYIHIIRLTFGSLAQLTYTVSEI